MDNTNNQSIDTRKRADLYAAFESVDNILLKKYIKNLVSAPVCILPEAHQCILIGRRGRNRQRSSHPHKRWAED